MPRERLVFDSVTEMQTPRYVGPLPDEPPFKAMISWPLARLQAITRADGEIGSRMTYVET